MKSFKLFFAIQLLSCIASAQIKINPIRYTKSALPIKVERTISFTTSEGSYLDVDISPDGSTILFSCLGELFSLPAKGGVATQLTRGLAINRCPIWSPDGQLIAYESDATGFVKLHVSNATVNFQKVLDVQPSPVHDNVLNPIWFPDSRHLYLKDDKIYHLTDMTSSLPEKIMSILGFSADGKFCYFYEDFSKDSSVIVKYERLNQDKTTLLTLTKELFIFNNPRISPDGNWLTYIKYRIRNNTTSNDDYTPADSLMAIDIRTGKEKLLAHLNIKFATNFLKFQHYSFSKDSKYLFIGYGGKIHRIEIENSKNDIIPFTANVKVDMGAFSYNRFPVSLDSLSVKYVRSARRSPDRKHLVFSALNKIYTLDLPNGTPHILVDQPFNQFEPSYSPDGKWICYVSWSDTSGGYLWRVSSQGGKPEQITRAPGLYMHPSWSPDGKLVAVVKGENELGQFSAGQGDGQLQIIAVKDSTIKFVENTVPLINEFMFCKEGKEIAFTPDQMRSGDKIWPRIVSRNIETKTESVLVYTRNSAELISPIPIRQNVLSPDEKYCAFVYNEDLYLYLMTDIKGVESIFDNPDHLPLIRFARGVIDPVWEEGGKILSWLDRNKYCSINPDKIIEAAVHLKPSSTLKGLPSAKAIKIIDVNIPVDQVTNIHLKVPRLKGNGIIAIKNARIITMRGNVIENGTAIVKNGRFISVAAVDKDPIPRGAKVFDLTGKTVMPGLIDMHSHMSLTSDILFEQSQQKLLHFSYGITTRRDPAANFEDFGYNELIETGQMLGTRSFTVGEAVRDYYNLNNLSDAECMVNNRAKYGAAYIKQYTQPSRVQRQLLLQACKEARLNMTNEVEIEPLYCLSLYKDGTTGIEHSPNWGDVYDDVISLVAKSGTYLCPTLQACFGKEPARYYFRKVYGQDFLNRSKKIMGNDGYKKEVLIKGINATNLDSSFLDQSRIIARIKHAGGKIVMGSHGEDQGIGAHWEIWALQMGGLTNYEALETATITAAEALGMQKDLGSIEVGKIADLIILDKNPLEDIHNTNTIKYVMKAGVLYDSETLNEIWPEKKKCPEWRMKSDAKNDAVKTNAAKN